MDKEDSDERDDDDSPGGGEEEGDGKFSKEDGTQKLQKGLIDMRPTKLHLTNLDGSTGRWQEMDLSVPLPEVPFDAMRHGLTTFQDRLCDKHPVQKIQDKNESKFDTLRGMYGLALPARMDIEKQILSRRGRLPPLPSSNFGYDVYFGHTGRFAPESYLGLEEFSERIPPDVHSQMEEIRGMDTKPATRGIL